ncbi:MAG: glycosyltransferase family 2 protein [Leptospiraceae bacterium]|nr:glycosyltransferase family 2 protein [Leptospiraceae bacterium]MDW8306175.1 glycosyltransferase family 2 protein [Leptospiraceae bacterium]
MKPKIIEISIIVPTYNERENVGPLIEKLGQVLGDRRFEVIVADDNSPDLTWQEVERLRAKYPWLRLIRRFSNRGLSPAVMEAMAAAQGNYFIVMDADLQHDPLAIPRFIEELQKGSDLVIGTRKKYGGKIEGWSKKRRFVSWVATLLANLFLPQLSSDPMSGFFGIKRDFYLAVAEKINPRGFKILLEFLSQSKGRKISEVGYTFRPRKHGKSKLSGNIMLQYLIGLYELRLGKIIPLKFIKYSVVGISGIFVNQFVLYLLRNVFKFDNEIALALAIEVSIISNFFFNNYFTFRQQKLSGFGPLLLGLLKFNFICLLGAIINYAVALWLTYKLNFNIYLSNFLGILLATLWNYVLNVQLTWQERKTLLPD